MRLIWRCPPRWRFPPASGRRVRKPVGQSRAPSCDRVGGGVHTLPSALKMPRRSGLSGLSGLKAVQAVADGVAGGVERLVEVGEEVELLGGAGLGGVGGEMRGHGAWKTDRAPQCARGSRSLHHAGVDDVFRGRGCQATASSRACGMSCVARVRSWSRSSVRRAMVCPS